MLLVASVLALLSIALLIVRPAWGIPAVFIARPFVDTTWADQIVGTLKLTELFSVAVPTIVLLHMLFSGTTRAAFRFTPLRWIWVLWIVDVTWFAGLILFNNEIADGFNIFFRHLNGFAGFYMLQAYFSDERYTKRILLAIAIAGLFPMGTGLYEALSGDHWKVTFGEGGLVRNIGMYHDAITIRYLALQTILAIMLLAVIYLRRRLIASTVATAFGIVSAFVMYGAYSKAGMLTLASWAVLWPTLLRQTKALLLLGLLGLGLAGFFSSEIVDTATRVFTKEIGVAQGDLGVERSFSGRWYVWAEMMDEWSRFTTMQQIFGSGHMALGAHNDYLIVLFHGGAFGLVLYCLLLLFVLVRIVRDLLGGLDPWSVAALLAFIMWMVDTIGLVPSAYSGYQWFVWGIIGLAFRKRSDARRDARATSRERSDAPSPVASSLA